MDKLPTDPNSSVVNESQSQNQESSSLANDQSSQSNRIGTIAKIVVETESAQNSPSSITPNRSVSILQPAEHVGLTDQLAKSTLLPNTTSGIERVDLEENRAAAAIGDIVVKTGDNDMTIFQREHVGLLPQEEREKIETQAVGYVPKGKPPIFNSDENRDLFFKLKGENKLKMAGKEGFAEEFVERMKNTKSENCIVFNDEAQWQNFNKEVAVIAEENRMSTTASQSAAATSSAASTEKPETKEIDISDVKPEIRKNVAYRMAERLVQGEMGHEARESLKAVAQEMLLDAIRDKRKEEKREVQTEKQRDISKSEISRQNEKLEIQKKETAASAAVEENIVTERVIDYIKFRAVSIAKGMLVNEEVFRQFYLELEDWLQKWKMDL